MLIGGLYKAVFVALVTYALLPIMKNVVEGINNVSLSIKDAARGMGMSDKQILMKVELPLALYAIFGGVRTSTVITIGAVALAAYIGADCLGTLILRGLERPPLLHVALAGGIICALLAISIEQIMEK